MHSFANVSRQRGQSLVLLAIAVAILSTVFAIWGRLLATERASQSASQQGTSLSQFALGLRGYIAAVQNGSVTMPTNPYIVTGVNFLKAPSCGGLIGNPTSGFVPCGFVAGSYSKSYRTTVTYTPASNTISAITSYRVDPSGNDKNAAPMAARVAYAANANAQPQNGIFMTVIANAPQGAVTQPAASSILAANRGRISLVVSNAPSNDIWLRTDGTNKMLADLNMGGNSIKNAQNASLNGDLLVKGVAQINGGLSVVSGPTNLLGGVLTPDVAVTSIGRMASQAFYDANVLTGKTSYQVQKPNCSQANLGNSKPAIYVAIQGTGSPGGQAAALYEAHVKVVNNGTYWTVSPVVEATRFSLSGSSSGGSLTLSLNKSLITLSPTDQTILVLTKCR